MVWGLLDDLKVPKFFVTENFCTIDLLAGCHNYGQGVLNDGGLARFRVSGGTHSPTQELRFVGFRHCSTGTMLTP